VSPATRQAGLGKCVVINKPCKGGAPYPPHFLFPEQIVGSGTIASLRRALESMGASGE